MLDINIFSDYLVNFNCNYTFINEYGDFEKGSNVYSENMNGVQLLDLIFSYTQDSDFCAISFSDKIFIEHFSPTSGECSDITIKYSVNVDTSK